MAEVQLTEDAREDLRDFDRAAQTQILRGLKKLETEPEKRGQPLGSKQLGDLTGFRKLVVGNRDCRIIYTVQSDGTVCVVWVIGKRADEEVYRLTMARLDTYAAAADSGEMRELMAVAFDSRTTS